MAWLFSFSGCESPTDNPSSQSSRTILNAGGARIGSDSGNDFSIRAAGGEKIPKTKWVSAYDSEIRKAVVVALVKLDGNNIATCAEVWKGQDGSPKVGEVIPIGLEHIEVRFNAENLRWYDPDKGIVVFFNKYPNPRADSKYWVSRDGLVMGDITLDELRAIALGIK